jgi:hypothetical protein
MDILIDVSFESKTVKLINSVLLCNRSEVTSVTKLKSFLDSDKDSKNISDKLSVDCNCWCKANDDEYYIRVVDDKLLLTLVNSYWNQKNQLNVIFRAKSDESPNASTINQNLPFSLPNTQVYSRINVVCPISLTNVTNINQNDRVEIFDNEKCIIVHYEYITKFIESQLAKFISIFEIEIESSDIKKVSYSIKLSSSVWARCLLRKHKGNFI